MVKQVLVEREHLTALGRAVSESERLYSELLTKVSAGRDEPPFVSVEERLPESSDGYVLVYIKHADGSPWRILNADIRAAVRALRGTGALWRPLTPPTDVVGA